ncbi:MAG: chorismate synthase, partial [Phycisphaerales bacterium]|nr:chorismate synthase [Phycisphaerales bacterium]
MAQLDYRTAGESHGQALIVLIEGAPAGLTLDTAFIDASLKRRQGGFGRGGRQKIETDVVNILSGVRAGESIGAPIAMQLANRDWRIDTAPPVHRPRPGHADFAGAMKYETDDCRSILERASARETASRTAAGAVARLLLREFGIDVVGFVSSIGDVEATIPDSASPSKGPVIKLIISIPARRPRKRSGTVWFQTVVLKIPLIMSKKPANATKKSPR